MRTSGDSLRSRVVLLAAALLLAGLAWPLFQGKVYISDDLGQFHLPVRAFYARCLAAGQSFHWFPGIFCGFDLHGEGQVGMYHPFHWLLYGWLPLGVAFNLELLVSYPALFAGTFLFLRRWDLDRDAAGLGAMLFTFAGFNLVHYKHLNVVAVVAHMPWLLLAADTAVRGTDVRRAAWARLGVGLLTTSQLLLGHPQSVWFSGLAESLYVLFLTLRCGGSPGRLVAWACAKVLGVLGGGVQWMPTWEALKQSYRHHPTREYLAFGSLHPGNLLQPLAPYLYIARVVTPPITFSGVDFVMPPATTLDDPRSHEFGLYSGAIVPVLFAWLLIRRKELGTHRQLAGLALVLGILALILALGSYLPLFHVTSRLPLFKLFRVPARYLVLAQFATAILAAIAFADLCGFVRRCQQAEWRRLWPFALLAMASLAIALAIMPLARRWPETFFAQSLAPTRAILIGPLLVGLASSLVVWAARGSRAALLGILVFAAVDQGTYGLSYVRHTPRVNLATYVATRHPPPTTGTPRVKLVEPVYEIGLAINDMRLIDGYAALTPVKRLDYNKPASQRVAGAEWVEEPKTDKVRRWSRRSDPLPRARLVSRWVATTEPNRDIDAIDLASTALVARGPACPGGEPGSATVIADRPGKIRIVADTPTGQLVVLNESYHPGWRVTVDGIARPALRVNGDFLGCLVKEGRHSIAFRYAPKSLRLGRLYSLLGVGLMLAWLFVSFRGSRAPAGDPVD